MQPLSKQTLSIVAVAAAALFFAAMLHCVIECQQNDGEEGYGCFCHLGVSDTSALGGLSCVLFPQSFVRVTSEHVDSFHASGVFRPPIA